jgi:hypothetical protein
MPRSAANRGLVASRIRDSKIKHSRVFHVAERACVRARQHQRDLVNGRAARVAGETSTRLAQDRQPMAIRNCCRNSLARQ